MLVTSVMFSVWACVSVECRPSDPDSAPRPVRDVNPPADADVRGDRRSYAFLISVPVLNYSEPFALRKDQTQATRAPFVPPRSAWPVPKALAMIQTNKTISEDYVELVEVPKRIKPINDTKNITGFFVENDSPGSMYTILSGLTEMQTILVACFLTILPLFTVLVITFGIRCAWKRMCPHYRDTSTVESGDTGEGDGDDGDGDGDGDDGDGDKDSSHSSEDTDDADDRRRGDLALKPAETGPKALCPTGYCLITDGPPRPLDEPVNGGYCGPGSSNHGPHRCPISPPHLRAFDNANGSVITMTLKDNHLIVETEERNDMNRSVRETKMSYSPQNEGVFVVEVQRGARYEPTAPKVSSPPRQRALVHRADPPPPAKAPEEPRRPSACSVTSNGYCYGTQLSYGDAYRGHLSPPQIVPVPTVETTTHTPRVQPDFDKPVVTAAIFKQDSVLGSDANLAYNIEGSSDGPLYSDVRAREVSLHILQEKKDLAAKEPIEETKITNEIVVMPEAKELTEESKVTAGESKAKELTVESKCISGESKDTTEDSKDNVEKSIVTKEETKLANEVESTPLITKNEDVPRETTEVKETIIENHVPHIKETESENIPEKPSKIEEPELEVPPPVEYVPNEEPPPPQPDVSLPPPIEIEDTPPPIEAEAAPPITVEIVDAVPPPLVEIAPPLQFEVEATLPPSEETEETIPPPIEVVVILPPPEVELHLPNETDATIPPPLDITVYPTIEILVSSPPPVEVEETSPLPDTEVTVQPQEIENISDLPAPIEDLPAPIVDLPAPIEDLPAPIEDLPAPIEDLPAPIEDLSAPVVDDLPPPPE